MDTVLEIKNLALAYGNQTIAHDISFTVEKDEVVCIVGRSGCGKTTLFHAIAGLSKPISGEILLHGKSIVNKPGSVSYMLQKDLLLPNKRIVDNVALPYIISGTELDEARQKAFNLLVQFNLDEYANSWPYELSGGMRQRVALLRTYANDNELILLDEAFSALDAITRMEVRTWFFDAIKASHRCVLAITHDIDEACIIGDKIYVMNYDEELGYSKLSHPIYNLRGNMDAEDYMLSDDFLITKQKIMNSLDIVINEKHDNV